MSWTAAPPCHLVLGIELHHEHVPSCTALIWAWQRGLFPWGALLGILRHSLKVVLSALPGQEKG